MITEEELRHRYARLLPHLNERQRRLVLGADAMEEGYGGISKVARAAGVCRDTVRAGIADLAAGATLDDGMVRQPGGGRRAVEVAQPGIEDALEALVEPVTRGDPESPLLWTSKSCKKLAAELRVRGFRVSHETVRRLLYALGENGVRRYLLTALLLLRYVIGMSRLLRQILVDVPYHITQRGNYRQ